MGTPMTAAFDPLKHPIMFQAPRRVNTSSAWLEHIPFAMFLVDVLRPGVFVELGTQKGDSYSAFCEAVERLGLGTRCYAVDTWTGDPQTGTYGPDVLAELRANHDGLYGGFSRLVQHTFDEALAHFSDESIDLLHIDGYHTYESARHDFEAWLPKMSRHGVVLFHDINVRERDFGVWRLWEEVRREYPFVEFDHAAGLGVVGVGVALPDAVRALFELSEEESVAMKRCFFRLGHGLRLRADLEAAQRGLADERAERDRAMEQLNGRLEQSTEAAAQLDRAMEQLNGQLAQAKAAAAERDRAMERLKSELEQVKETGAERERVVERLKGEREQELQLEAGQLRQEMNVLLASRSWKLTAPLRRFWSVCRSCRRL